MLELVVSKCHSEPVKDSDRALASSTTYPSDGATASRVDTLVNHWHQVLHTLCLRNGQKIHCIEPDAYELIADDERRGANGGIACVGSSIKMASSTGLTRMHV